MGTISNRPARPRRAGRSFDGPRPDDPRVIRTRAAVVDAARTLFLEKGYAGTTMEDIASLAGLTKGTVYNNYADKEALFMQVVGGFIAYAEEFARGLRQDFGAKVGPANLRATLEDLGRRLTLAVVRPEVVALRRLLIGEARTFPELAKDYFDRAPGQVIDALTEGFELWRQRGLLELEDARSAAAQFAYLVAGEPLDRAILVGIVPPRTRLIDGAREGVATFVARYAPQLPA